MVWLAQWFELSRGEDGHNVRTMEGLRDLAIFLVFLVQYATLIAPWVSETSILLALSEAIHDIGNTGVDLFFVLSGYLIYGSLISREQTFGHFMARRIRRIYPAFLVVFATYIVLSFIFVAESKIPSDPFRGALYLL